MKFVKMLQYVVLIILVINISFFSILTEYTSLYHAEYYFFNINKVHESTLY